MVAKGLSVLPQSQLRLPGAECEGAVARFAAVVGVSRHIDVSGAAARSIAVDAVAGGRQ